MTNKNHKKTRLFVFALITITTAVLALNSNASPSAEILGCHPGGYTITCNVSKIKAEALSNHTIEVTGTGPGVVIDVYTGGKEPALDNDLFIIWPSNVIADQDPTYDLDPNPDSIRVLLNITLPSEVGIYTLRILSRETTRKEGGTALKEFDIEVTVGSPVSATPSFLELFFNHSGLYIGGAIMFLTVTGTIVFHINTKKRQDARYFGSLFALALLLATINIFLVMNNAIESTINSLVPTSNREIDPLTHMLLGSIGYIAGIIVVFGTFTNVPAQKIKLPVYIMLMGWTFNYLFGIFMFLPIGGG